MKTPLKVAAVALVVLAGCYMLLPGASEAGQPGQYKTAYGVVVYLGVKPARVIKAQPQTYPELHARGTIPRGRNDQYVSVALFESSSGDRIKDAQVSALVLRNAGKGSHTFVSEGFFQAIATQKLISTVGEVAAPYLKTVEVPSQTQKDLHFVAVRRGTYPLECSVVLHDTFGMESQITIQ
jgi:hypothetical protein